MSEDIRKLLTVSETAPEEAAKNISRAGLFDISPDAYSGLKTELEPEARAIERTPAQIEPKTQEYVKQSEQHASLASEDIDKMNFFEKRAKYLDYKVLEEPKTRREINDIISKKMDSPDGKIDEGDEEMLQNLISESKNKAAYFEKFDLSGGEELATDVAAGVGDFIRPYWDNKELIAGVVGTGTAIGAGVGSLVPAIGTVAGATAGFVKGAVGASTLVGFIDGYQQTSRGLYGELMGATDDQGQPLNIPHSKMVNVSQGVGFFSGAASALAGKVLASNNPFLKRFLTPASAAKYIGKTPALMAKMDIIGGITKSALSEGAEEGFQELIQIFGDNFAKIDGSEASFMNALDASVESLQKTFSGENLKRAGYSGVVGGLTGGLIQTVTSAPGYKGLKDRYSEVEYVTQRKQEVLSAQNNMLELADTVKQMKMKDLSPSEMTNFQKRVFSSLGIDENVYMHLEDMREFANSPEKGVAIRKAIDPTGDLTKMAQELNTPISISKADFLNIVTEFPDVTEYMRLTPDGENPLAVRNEARDFSEKLTDAESKRQGIIESLGVDGEMTPEMQSELDSAMTPLKESKYFSSRDEYMGQSAIAPVEGVINQKEVDKLNKEHFEAREAVDKATIAPVDQRFDKYADAEFKTDTEAEINIEIDKLKKEYAAIESFGRTKDLSDVDKEMTKGHSKSGFSPFAIDPKSLSVAQRAMYFDNNDLSPSAKKNLKQRKAFVDGGIHVDEAAVLNGFDSGEDLLKALAETPTKKQIEQRIKNDPLRNATKHQAIAESMEATKAVARDEAFTRLTKVHLKEMDHMVKNSWPTVKRGIIKIAGKVPTVEALNNRAKATVSKMKIRDLNENSFKQGENRSQKAAVKNFVDGEFEQAFANKEKAALNNEFRKETVKALDKVSKFEKFWKRATSESNLQELKDAGMSSVMEEFMSGWKLDGNLKGETEQKNFNDWIKRQADDGNFVPVIPDRLDNTQASYKDLTVEQYQAMTEMGQYILHQAKLKNKLLANAEARNELRTAETIAEDIEQATESHVNFDPKKAEKKDKDYLSFTEKIKEGVGTSLSAISSIKTIVSELDEHKLNGYFHNLIGRPIKESRTAKRGEIRDIETQDKNIIEQIYGMDNFKKMFNEFVEIPEFSNIPDIGDGEGFIRKVDLLVLQAYMGDPDGREAVVNFKTRNGISLDVEQVQNILNTHLDEKDAAFVQNFLVDRFKRFEDRSFALHKKTTGIDPDMVKGVPVVHKGKVLPGGYYPIRRKMITDDVRAGNFLADIKDKMSDLGVAEEGHFYARMRTAEMTQQGRLKDRTGSKRPLDLSFENVFEFTEEAVHDLHFREVGIDILKVLKNPLNVKNMKSVIGSKKFVALLNGVKDTISKTTERESTLFGEEHAMVNGIIQKAHSLHAVKAIGMNFTSAAIQGDSLTNLMLRVGPKTGVYLAKHAAKMTKNIVHYEKYVQLAQEINPDIKFEQDNIDNAIVKQSYDYIPASNTFFKQYKTSSAQRISRIRDLQKKAIDASFYMVRESDKFNKVLMTHALSEQFLNGDIDGYPTSVLETMSDAEKAKTMRSIIQQASDTSLTASAPEDRTPIEKNQVARVFVRYWTDRRSRLNSVLAQIDKTKGAIRKGDNAQAAKHVLTLALAMGGSAAFIAAVRNEEESIFKKLGQVKDSEDVGEFALDTLWSFAKAPIDQTLDTIPLIDNIKYQSELKVRSDYRNVSTPLFGVASDVAAGIVIMKEVLDQALKGRTTQLNDTQRKILLSNAGYIAGGAPTNAIYKALDALNGGAVRKGSKHIKLEVLELHKNIDSYIKEFKDEPEAGEFIEDLKEYKKSLPQFDADVKNIIPENTKETLKTSLSQGKWDKFDSDTGAAGIYQFTEQRWKELMTVAPDLGLTENGRVSKSPEQQEKAMNWVIQDNTRGLLTYEIPITEANLLGAHKFGFDNFAAIYESKDGEKLTVALGEAAKNPVFKDFNTVGEVKSYLSKAVRIPK